MIKDRLLKAKLLEYYIRRFWYPHLEVVILSKQRISNTRKVITDIDVLALYTDITNNFQIVLGDCKTLKNQSPITRTLWMRGLMDYTNSSKGLILLTKAIEKEHQLTASILDVQLLSDTDFKIYSKSTADYLLEFSSALNDIDLWDKFFDIKNRYQPLAPFVEFSNTIFWNEQNSNYQLRSSIYLLRTYKGEFNPATLSHQTVLLNHFSHVAIAINGILIKIFNQYLIPADKTFLDTDLKIIIYGGVENYDFLNDLRKRFSSTTVAERDLQLPEWDMFIELIRLLFESPQSFSKVPLILKEIAFTLLGNDPTKYNYAKYAIGKDKYAPTFAIRLIEYLCKASGIPREFQDAFCAYVLIQ